MSGMEMGAGSGLFSSAMDIVNQKVAQEYRSQDRAQEQDYNSYMSNTAVSRRAADMQRAGINPILAAGSPAAGGSGSPSPSGYGGSSTFGAGMHAGVAASMAESQMAVNSASANKMNAEAETERNRPENVRADTDVKRGTEARIEQEIRESAQRIDKMSYEMEHLAASAETQRAMGTKVREETKHIEQLVTSVKQSNKANLPEVQRWIKEVERELLEFQKPGAFNNAAVQESFLGRMSTLIKSFSPIIK